MHFIYFVFLFFSFSTNDINHSFCPCSLPLLLPCHPAMTHAIYPYRFLSRKLDGWRSWRVFCMICDWLFSAELKNPMRLMLHLLLLQIAVYTRPPLFHTWTTASFVPPCFSHDGEGRRWPTWAPLHPLVQLAELARVRPIPSLPGRMFRVIPAVKQVPNELWGQFHRQGLRLDALWAALTHSDLHRHIWNWSWI